MTESGPRAHNLSASEKQARIESGREFCRLKWWRQAYQSLSIADQSYTLEATDLEQYAISAYLIGREDEFVKILERAHHAYLEKQERRSAARCAFWMGLSLMFEGKMGPASGWLGRAQRVLEEEGSECVEQGYLLLPEIERLLGEGDLDSALRGASLAADFGHRFGDQDLVACARHLQGRILIRQEKVADGLALLDEAMVAATAGELSPIMTGLIYCSVIGSCQQVYEVGRASEWTTALSGWCDQQPEMIAFTGTCLIRRAEIMQIQGSWQEAIGETNRARERFRQGIDRKPPAAAVYQQGEVYRLRGEFEKAEEAYRLASEWGWEPQPGLALMRMIQEQVESAVQGIQRVLGTTEDPLKRAPLLAACVEITLAAGQVETAREACLELSAISKRSEDGFLGAMAAQARGSLELADGDANEALASLRIASRIWREVDAPYLAARAQMLVGLACRALGDKDTCELELSAARSTFERLGAVPDIERLDEVSNEP